MFCTKKDVDRHSQDVLKKLRTEKERNLRSLSIAQQYYNVFDYESARRFVLMYLSVKDDSSSAHKLLAQCYEKFQEKDKALKSYIYSLQLDPKQPELILKVCELLTDDDVVVDKEQLKHWCEKGEEKYPYHPIIQKLKKQVSTMNENSCPATLEAVVSGAVTAKPNDPVLHTQLLLFYVDNGRVREAYEEAFNRNIIFTPSIQWYQAAVKICKVYKIQFPNSLNEDFYANNLLVLERLVALAVQDVKLYRKSITECVSFLARFDEILSEAVLLINKSEKYQFVLNHMCGQLCFHTANILYRKLKWEDNNWQELTQLISPLLLLSTSTEFKIADERSAETNLSRVLNICSIYNKYRILQAGLVLLIMAKDSPKQFIEKIFHLCVANYWKDRIFDKVYNTSDYKTFRKTSFFMNYSEFSKLPPELPKYFLENIEQNLNVIETVQKSSLHHLTWLGVQYLNKSDKKSICDISLPYQFYIRNIHSLQLSSSCTTSGYAESLCKLDLDAFLYACIFCAKATFEHQSTVDQQYAYTLPADVSKPMCTPEQEQWWEYAYQIINKSVSETSIPRTRSIVQRGIESIRMLGNNMLPLPVLVLLGRTFTNRAAVESDSDRASALEDRAALYWKAAIPTLERITRNETYITAQKTMFEYFRNTITKSEAIKLLDEGRRMVGMQMTKEGNYTESIPPLSGSFNESFGEVHNLSINNPVPTSNVVEEKLTKIMDKLEVLFSKQELLCSNQLQLTDMIATLTKKVENSLFPDYDEFFDSQTQPTSNTSQPALNATQPNFAFPSNISTALSLPTQPSLGNVSSNQFTKLQTNYPMYMFNHSQGPTTLNNNYPMFTVSPNVINSYTSPGYFSSQSVTTSVPSQFASSSAYADVASRYSAAKDSYGGSELTLNASMTAAVPDVAGTPLFLQQNATTPEPSSITGSPELRKIAVTTTTSILSTPVSSSTVKQGALNVTQITPPVAPAESTYRSPKTTFSSFFGFDTPITTSTSNFFQIPMGNTTIQGPSVEIPQKEESDEEQPAEHDPMPDFKPIIPLPDEVDVKTGEENETVLFENRVKLFRFVEKEWKERGIGSYKILKNHDTGKVRALMRREIVHKICANHFLSDDMVLSPMIHSDRAWVYCAPDYADEQLQVEKFCIKFKTVEEAKRFYDVFNMHKSANVTPKKPSAEPKPVLVSTPLSAAREDTGSDKKEKKIVLTPSVIQFNQGNTNEKVPEKPAAATSIFANLSVSKAPVAPEPEKKSPFAGFTGFSLGTLQAPVGGLFKSSVLSEKPKQEGVTEVPAFSAVNSTLDFSSLAKSASETSSFAKSKDFKGFAGAGSLVFGGHAANAKIEKPVSNLAEILKSIEKKDTSITQNDSVNEKTATVGVDEFVPTAEFQPVIPLPDLVEVKTGEEGLEVLYEEQCKLYRFVNDEWRERGVGKMKILRDGNDGSIRLLMRRDQVHKLCCNQRLTTEHELKPLSTTNKAWSWCAQDFSDGELKNELLCIRFKTAEQTKEFKTAFEDAKLKLGEAKTPSKEPSKKDPLPSLSEMFKKDASSWECKMCYVTNKKDVDMCVACNSPKNPEAAKAVSSTAAVVSSKFSFGIPPTVEKEKPAVLGTPASDTKTGFNFGSATTITAAATSAAPITTTTFSFNLANTTNTSANVGTSSVPSFSFGGLKSNIAVAPQSTPEAKKADPIFSFGNLSVSKQNSSGEVKPFSFGNFSPSLNKQEVNANVFDLSNKSQANVSIFGGSPQSKQSEAFSTFSFGGNKSSFLSENKLVSPNEALQKENVGASDKSSSTSGEEVEFVSEINVTEDEKKLAESLMLPKNYYAYKYKEEDCPGCVGCENEDKENKTISKENVVTTNTPLQRPEFSFGSIGSVPTPPVLNAAPGSLKQQNFVFGDITNASGSWVNKSNFNFGNIFNKSKTETQKSPEKATAEESGTENDDEVVKNDHEPYFEPIVPLPDIVEIRTGEENEAIKFCERSKLFRFSEDTKEWKERGVGDLKILYHPTDKTYRLLLRREQVHKIVLNQRVSSGLSIQPLSSSKNSWCWFGMNFTEENSEPVLEKLAVRFKTEEISNQFQEILESCINELDSSTNAETAENTVNVTDPNEPGARDQGYKVEEEDYDNKEEEYQHNEYDAYYDERYSEEDHYVDERGIEEAMEDYSSEGDVTVLFEKPAVVQMIESNDSVIQYDGTVQLHNRYDEIADVCVGSVVFATDEVSEFYKADLTDNMNVINEEDGSVTIEEYDGTKFERRMNIRFNEEKLAEEFCATFREIVDLFTSNVQPPN